MLGLCLLSAQGRETRFSHLPHRNEIRMGLPSFMRIRLGASALRCRGLFDVALRDVYAVAADAGADADVTSTASPRATYIAGGVAMCGAGWLTGSAGAMTMECG